jgi:uncharacterized membrane protein
MKQAKIFYVLFPFVMMTIPWVYLAYIWNDLPATIPTHFGGDGLPDNFGDKLEIIIAPIILGIVGLLSYFVLQNIHKIDPKKKYTEGNSVLMKKLSVIVIILLSFLSLLILYSTLKGKIAGAPLLFCGLSLFLAYIGNLMHSIKPNYFAGIRVPWTLENEDNWRKTHQLASKIWFTGGIILALLSLILNLKILFIVFMICIFAMSIIPLIYSYAIYKNLSK